MRKDCGCENINWGHPSRHVEVNGIGACLDLDMIPVCTYLWERGIRTEGSCQGWPEGSEKPRKAHLMFFDARDMEQALEHFVGAAYRSGNGPLFARAAMNGTGSSYNGPDMKDEYTPVYYTEADWKVEFEPFWWFYAGEPHPVFDPTERVGRYSIWMDPSDVPLLGNALTEHGVPVGEPAWPRATELPEEGTSGHTIWRMMP